MLTPVRTDDASVARTDPQASRAHHVEVIGLVALIVLGAALRFVTIAHQSYWVDEATTVHELSLSFGGLMHAIHVQESTPPLYYVLAWVWAKVFGTGELGLRSLSALAGTALIPVAYACGRELVSRGTGLVAAALTALSPFLIWYSQEARAYMLFALLCGISLLFFARALRRAPDPPGRDLALWAGFSALALLTHFFAGFLLAPEGLWLLWRLRSRSAVVAVLGSRGRPGRPAAAIAERSQQPAGLDRRVSARGAHQTGPGRLRPQHALPEPRGHLRTARGRSPGHRGARPARPRRRPPAPAGRPLSRRGWAPSPSWSRSCSPPWGRDYLVARNLIAAWLPVAVLLAAACTAPRTLPFGAVLAAVLLGAFVYAGFKINASPQYERPDWRGVARALGTAGSARAIVAYDSSYATQPLSLYLPRIPWTQRIAGPVSVGEVDVVANAYSTPSARLPAGVRRVSATTVGGFLVLRYAVSPGWRLTPAAIGQRASALVPGAAAPAVLIQPGPA